jgi:hypothetical protein
MGKRPTVSIILRPRPKNPWLFYGVFLTLYIKKPSGGKERLQQTEAEVDNRKQR